jgi:hypothetical protein
MEAEAEAPVTTASPRQEQELVAKGNPIKNIALFLAAPFIGLAYIVAMPFVGIGMIAWFGFKAVMKR